MQIRKMLSSDYDEIYHLWLSCPGMGLNNLDDSREGIEKFLNRNPNTCFVAEAELKAENLTETTQTLQIIGVIMAGNDGRRGYIYHTAVHPEYRHQGIATQLVEAALTALEEEGIHKAAMLVFEKNKEGNLFWEKQGFTTRTDIIYRNKTITDMIRIDT